MWVALALYDLLKGVNQRHASVMLTLIVVSIPIALLNELNAIAALILVRGADFLTIFDKSQRDALAMLFLNLHSQGFGVAAIFWGLWLFPLGLLVYRSRFFPRILGVLLIAHCFYYLVTRSGFTSSGDLAFDANGVLYGALNQGANVVLAKIDRTSDAAAAIGPTGFSTVYGLAIHCCRFFGGTSAGELLSINAATGQATLIGKNSVFMGGMSARLCCC